MFIKYFVPGMCKFLLIWYNIPSDDKCNVAFQHLRHLSMYLYPSDEQTNCAIDGHNILLALVIKSINPFSSDNNPRA